MVGCLEGVGLGMGKGDLAVACLETLDFAQAWVGPALARQHRDADTENVMMMQTADPSAIASGPVVTVTMQNPDMMSV